MDKDIKKISRSEREKLYAQKRRKLFLIKGEDDATAKRRRTAVEELQTLRRSLGWRAKLLR